MSSANISPSVLGAEADPAIDADALRMAGTLLRFVRLLDSALRTGQAGDGLTLADANVLGQVSHGHALPSLIARALQLDPARVTRITDRLVGLGYLERESDPADRRRCVLRITDAGCKRLDQAKADLSRATTSVLDALPIEERASLLRSVEGIRAVIDTR